MCSTTIPNGSTCHHEKTDGVEMVTTFYFYVLIDPRDDIIKYVGRTVDMTHRYYNHIYEAKTNNRNKRERWIVSLLRRNLKPIMKKVYVKHCHLKEAHDIERMLIQTFGKRYPLKNGDDHGIGLVLHGTPVYQYSLDGQFMKRYHNASQAMISTGVKDSNIGRCVKNVNGYGTKTAGGYFWSMIQYDTYPYKYIKNWKSLTGKTVYQYTLAGEFIQEYSTARLAEKSTGVSYKKISATCNNRQKSGGGFIWKFKKC